jgi:hypothetical protein
MSNVNLSTNLQNNFLNDLSSSPFIDRNTDHIYTTMIIPEFQKNIRELKLNCTDCFLSEMFQNTFVQKFKAMEFCSFPPSKDCKESLTSAVIMIAKIQAMFSIPILYLGTAVEGGIVPSDTGYLQQIYSKLAGQNTTVQARVLALILSTGTEMDFSKATTLSKVVQYDEMSEMCWGLNYLELNMSCTELDLLMYPGVIFTNFLLAGFALVDPKSIKNTVKSSVSFDAFGICMRKSCTLNVDEIEPRLLLQS